LNLGEPWEATSIWLGQNYLWVSFGLKKIPPETKQQRAKALQAVPSGSATLVILYE